MRLVLMLVVLLAGPALAGPERATFDVYLGGVRAGTLSLAGEEAGSRYAASGVLESGGLIGALRRMRYDAAVRGRVLGDGPSPEYGPRRYTETRHNNRDVNERAIVWRDGLPRIRGGGRKGLDPATQAGTIDPLTAIWGVLRDVGTDEACRFSGEVFDGSRRSRVALAAPERGANAISCAGEYRRVAGYDADEMADPAFPFRLTYRPAGADRWQVARIDMQTVFGRGAMIRR